MTGTGPAASAGVVRDVDRNPRPGRVVHMPRQPLDHDRDIADLFCRGADHLPCHPGQVGRDAAQYLAIEVLRDLQTALRPPDLGRGHALAVLEQQRVGQAGVNVGLRLVVIDRVRRFGIMAGPWPEFLDAEQVHEQLVILLRGCPDRQLLGRRRKPGRRRGWWRRGRRRLRRQPAQGRVNKENQRHRHKPAMHNRPQFGHGKPHFHNASRRGNRSGPKNIDLS